MRLVIFCEADGLLGQVADESPGAEAAGVLSRISGSTAIVICSMRTRAQIEQIQHGLGIAHPFVAEGGSAVFIPEGYFPVATTSSSRHVAGYEAIDLAGDAEATRRALKLVAARQHIDVVGFADMSVSDVARERGLSLLDARLAKLRDHSECFRLAAPDEANRRRLGRALRAAGLRCVEDDRFNFVSSSRGYCAAVRVLSSLYGKLRPAPLVVVSLADANGGRCGQPPHSLEHHWRTASASRSIVAWALAVEAIATMEHQLGT